MEGDPKPDNTNGKRVFVFSAPRAGILTITGYKQSSYDATLSVLLDKTTVNANNGSEVGFTSTSEPTSCIYSIAKGGEVVFYSAKKAYFHSISFSFTE